VPAVIGRVSGQPTDSKSAVQSPFEDSSAECGQRIEYLDVLKLLAIAGVVFVHASAVKSDMASFGSPVWHIVNLLNVLASTGVPLFLMVSGALLLGSRRTLSVGYTLRRRVPRLIVPLLAWSAVYIAYRFLMAWVETGTTDWSTVVHKVAYLPLRPVEIPFWFMYAIIPIYILSPLLKGLVDALSRELAIYLVVLWVLFASLVPTISTIFSGHLAGVSFALDPRHLIVAPLFVGFFLVGHYLMKLERRIRKGG
jgi:surface polysaccharide O-acyltransferase-like enzyme